MRGGRGGKEGGKKHVSCVRRHEQLMFRRASYPPQLRRIVIGHDAYTIINDCENKEGRPMSWRNTTIH